MTARASLLEKYKSHNEKTLKDKWPLAKVKGIYCNKFSFLQDQTINRQILQRQSTIHLQCSLPTKHYSSPVQAAKIFNDKTLFRYSTIDKFSNKLRLLSEKVEAIIKSRQPAVPTAGISFYKISNLNNSLKAYIRQCKSKEKAERNY